MILENMESSVEGYAGADVTEVSVADDTPKQPEVVAAGNVSGENVRLMVDPQTGKRQIVFADEAQEADGSDADASGDDDDDSGAAADESLEQDTSGQATSDNQQETQGNEQLPGSTKVQVSQYYTPQELNLALALGSVDEKRVAPEYAVQYGEHKARIAFMQKQKEQAETERQQELAGKSEAEQMQEFHTKVEQMAQQSALAELGFADLEELEAAEFGEDDKAKARAKLYRNSVETHRLNILRDIQAETVAKESAAREQKQLAQDIMVFLNSKRKDEPNFVEIFSLMDRRYMEMPYDKAANIVEALKAVQSGSIKREHLPTLEKYYEDTRVKYYADKNSVSTVPQPTKKKQPAKVEKPGSGADVPAEKPNARDLRGMNHRDKTKWFEQFA